MTMVMLTTLKTIVINDEFNITLLKNTVAISVLWVSKKYSGGRGHNIKRSVCLNHSHVLCVHLYYSLTCMNTPDIKFSVKNFSQQSILMNHLVFFHTGLSW